jgi:putative polyhydroxyalkanoate system protein
LSELRIHREHSLGLARAREIARQWADEAESRFQMSCTFDEGRSSDRVDFKRSGVHGTLVVAGDHFDLHAKLGFLLGAFAKTIEREIEKTLDDLLASSAAAAARKPAAKTATKTAVKAAHKTASKTAR